MLVDNEDKYIIPFIFTTYPLFVGCTFASAFWQIFHLGNGTKVLSLLTNRLGGCIMLSEKYVLNREVTVDATFRKIDCYHSG